MKKVQMITWIDPLLLEALNKRVLGEYGTIKARSYYVSELIKSSLADTTSKAAHTQNRVIRGFAPIYDKLRNLGAAPDGIPGSILEDFIKETKGTDRRTVKKWKDELEKSEAVRFEIRRFESTTRPWCYIVWKEIPMEYWPEDYKKENGAEKKIMEVIESTRGRGEQGD